MLQLRSHAHKAQPLFERTCEPVQTVAVETSLESADVAVVSRGLFGHGMCSLITPMVGRVTIYDDIDGLLVAGDAFHARLIVIMEPSAKNLILGELAMLARRCQSWRTILLTQRISDVDQTEAIAAGARGCITYDTPPRQIAGLLELVLSGHIVWPTVAAGVTSLTGIYPPAAKAHDERCVFHAGTDQKLALLSKREREVLMAVSRGLGNKRIAGELNISDTTVRLHMRSIMRKLGAENRTQVALSVAGAAI